MTTTETLRAGKSIGESKTLTLQNYINPFITRGADELISTENLLKMQEGSSVIGISS